MCVLRPCSQKLTPFLQYESQILDSRTAVGVAITHVTARPKLRQTLSGPNCAVIQICWFFFLCQDSWLMPLSHHAFTDNIYQRLQGNIYVYECAHSIQLVMTDNCGDTGSDCRCWYNHYLEMTTAFYYLIICPSSIQFCSTVMILCAFVLLCI